MFLLSAKTDSYAQANIQAIPRLQSAAETSPSAQYKNEVIVTFKSQPDTRTLIQFAQQVPGTTPQSGIPSTNTMVFTVAPDKVIEAATVAAQQQNVQAAFPNYLLHLSVVPNDPFLGPNPTPGANHSFQWNMFNMKLADTGDSAWNHTTGADSVVVGVVDSGVDSSHPDLSSKLATLVNCTLATCTPVSSMSDDATLSHGTHVSGIVAAATNNSSGVAGTGYNVKFMVLKVQDSSRRISLTDVDKAVRYAVEHGVKIINMSLGAIDQNLGSDGIAFMNAMVDYAWTQKGALVVVSAGNCGAQPPDPNECALSSGGVAYNPKMYPAASPNALAVAALTASNALASYSEHNSTAVGNWISVAAPGGDFTSRADAYNGVLSTYPGGYAYMAGTSMAAPHVAGLAALLLSMNPNLTNQQLKTAIESTANSALGGNATLHGGVNALAAVASVTPVVTLTPSPTITPGGPTLTPTVTPTPTNTVQPTNTPSPSPSPTMTPYPTTGIARLPRIPPVPYPPAPYCPATIISSTTNCSSEAKLAGDANCDGRVDNADYQIWLQQYDTMPPARPVNNNANFACVEGNSQTYFADLVDFEVWRRGMFSPTTPYPTATSQPEPTVTLTPTVTTTVVPTATPTPAPTTTVTPTISPSVPPNAQCMNQCENVYGLPHSVCVEACSGGSYSSCLDSCQNLGYSVATCQIVCTNLFGQ